MVDRPKWARPKSELFLDGLLKGNGHESVMFAFTWANTVEGDEFWERVHEGIQKITPQIFYRLYEMKRELLELSKDG